MIEVAGVRFEYGGQGSSPALDSVDLRVEEGEFVAVVGANGSGKSTLIKLVNGLLKPSAGSVSVDGRDTSNEDEVWAARKLIGLCLQNPDNQIVGDTVEHDVAFGLENLGWPRERMKSRVDEVLAELGISHLAHRSPGSLSGGEKQKVVLAGALAPKPKYLVLDEPTSMLDPVGRREILSTLLRLNKQGITILMVTNKSSEAALAERVVVLVNGRISVDARPEDVFLRENLLAEFNLDTPPVAALARKLIKDNIIREPVVTREGLIDACLALVAH